MRLNALPSSERGVSLVELMIAVALASFLLIGLIQVFGASRQAYQTSVGISRIQEGGRFAFEFLQRDLRMAGHLGWANDVARMYSATYPAPAAGARVSQLDNLMVQDADADQFNSALELSGADFPFRFDVALQGFEAANTAPGETITLAGRDVATADHWTPALDADFYDDITPKPLAGSDVVVMRFLGQEGVPVRFDKDANTVTYASTTDVGFIRASRYYGIANYGAAALFQAPAAPTGSTITVAAGAGGQNERLFLSASEPLRGNVMLYPANIYAYYVGLGASGVPSLFRAVFSNNAWTSEELVEGVEVLQLTYGRDRLVRVPVPAPPALPEVCPAGGGQCLPDGSVDAYVTAAELVSGLTTEADRAARWRSVGAVRVGMLVRSTERAGTPNRDETNTNVGRLQIGRSVIDLPEGDFVLRRPYESTVALRNRLYGN
jgi:type IV pilus assembly protein PilW